MKQVPLVVYTDGKRKVIGEAVVHDDGTIIGTMNQETSLTEVLDTGTVFGFSLDTFRETPWVEQSERLF